MVYKEIPSSIIKYDEKCTTDLYIKIRDEYRLFAAKGATFSTEHLNLFDRAGVSLYILASDLNTADAFLENHLTEVLTNPTVPMHTKVDIVYSTSMSSIRDVFQGTNLRNINELEKISGKVVKFILSDSRVMDGLINITSHDHYTYKHSVKVGIYGTALSINLFQDKIRDHNMAELSTAYFLHDIGMAKVPAKILDKKGPLTPNEWDIIRKHPLWGHDKLVKANYLNEEAIAIVLNHHERCDKNGYPFRKSSQEIPLYARICAIADTFESLTSGRPFRQSKTPFEALKIMQVEMAKEFDPDLFMAFIKLLGPG